MRFIFRRHLPPPMSWARFGRFPFDWMLIRGKITESVSQMFRPFTAKWRDDGDFLYSRRRLVTVTFSNPKHPDASQIGQRKLWHRQLSRQKEKETEEQTMRIHKRIESRKYASACLKRGKFTSFIKASIQI